MSITKPAVRSIAEPAKLPEQNPTKVEQLIQFTQEFPQTEVAEDGTELLQYAVVGSSALYLLTNPAVKELRLINAQPIDSQGKPIVRSPGELWQNDSVRWSVHRADKNTPPPNIRFSRQPHDIDVLIPASNKNESLRTMREHEGTNVDSSLSNGIRHSSRHDFCEVTVVTESGEKKIICQTPEALVNGKLEYVFEAYKHTQVDSEKFLPELEKLLTWYAEQYGSDEAEELVKDFLDWSAKNSSLYAFPNHSENWKSSLTKKLVDKVLAKDHPAGKFARYLKSKIPSYLSTQVEYYLPELNKFNPLVSSARYNDVDIEEVVQTIAEMPLSANPLYKILNTINNVSQLRHVCSRLGIDLPTSFESWLQISRRMQSFPDFSAINFFWLSPSFVKNMNQFVDDSVANGYPYVNISSFSMAYFEKHVFGFEELANRYPVFAKNMTQDPEFFTPFFSRIREILSTDQSNDDRINALIEAEISAFLEQKFQQEPNPQPRESIFTKSN